MSNASFNIIEWKTVEQDGAIWDRLEGARQGITMVFRMNLQAYSWLFGELKDCMNLPNPGFSLSMHGHAYYWLLMLSHLKSKKFDMPPLSMMSKSLASCFELWRFEQKKVSGSLPSPYRSWSVQNEISYWAIIQLMKMHPVIPLVYLSI